jgi:tRNA threonylcarbamoyladenosine biosynthesis protein TsaE
VTVERISRSEDETMRLARSLAAVLPGGAVIGLEGPLGSGKTCFVRGLADGLGLDTAEVSSPTFVICKLYGEGGPTRLAHLDAFRLSGTDELESVGWDELLSQTETIVAVEWPSRIAGAMPPQHIAITLAHEGETVRRLTLSGVPDIESAWLR